MNKRLTLLPLAALLAALAPGAAHASTLCSYNVITHDVTVTMTAGGDAASVSRSGSSIDVNGTPCGLATVANTVHVLWDDQSGADTAATLDLSGGLFGPNIDFTYDAGSGADTFNVWGTPQNDHIRVGSDGLDGHVNADYLDDPTSDVDLQSVETVDVNGGGGSDTIDAGAHYDTGGYAFPGALYEEGALGDDTLTGGSGPAYLTGGAGNDSLSAGGQAYFSANPGVGDDTVTGELLGNDVLSYSDVPAGVHVDLKRTDKQDTGGAGVDQIAGFRKVIGSNYDDVLAGTEGADVITGGNGNDVLTGRGGDDKLIGGLGRNTVSYADPSPGVTSGVAVSLASQGVAQDTLSEGKDTLSGISDIVGSPFDDSLTGDAGANRIDGGGGADTVNAGDGADTLLLRDGIRDHADCGGADDTVQSDAQGLDVLSGCEHVDFAPSPAGPDQPGGGGQPGGLPGPTADTALTFRFTARAHQRLGRKGTLRVALSCPDEACTGDVSAKLAARSAAHRTIAVHAGVRKLVTVKLSAKSLRRARAALRHGKRVTVKLTAVGRDAAGNRRTVTRTVVLRA
jgi:Ca2+-binding RTX toxin-like protein